VRLLLSLVLLFPLALRAQSDFRVVKLVEGLDHPWSLAFLPDGPMLVTERPGRGRREHRACARQAERRPSGGPARPSSWRSRRPRAACTSGGRMVKGVLGRIRDVRIGPGGYLYLLTDENPGVLARLEP